MARDVGGYFEKLTKRGPGGRRLDTETGSVPTTDRESDRDLDRDVDRDVEPAAPPARSKRGGGVRDILADVLARGRSTTSRTAQKTRDRVRDASPKRRHPTATRSRRSLPPEGVVTIEYSPSIDGDPDPGEVVWTWVPFEDLPEQGKDRPVVVIGRRGSTLVGIPLTTKRNGSEAQIAIGTGAWDPKRRQSYARIWRMLDLDADRMRREGAVLGRARFDQVTTAVDEYYDVRRATPAGRAGDDFDY